MLASAYCTAYSYRLKPLAESLRGRYVTHTYRDVLHVVLPDEGTNDTHDAFYFSFGALVCWDIHATQLQQLLDAVRPFEENRMADVEEDRFTVQVGEKLAIANDEVILPNNAFFTRLAASHAFGQSVKLGAFELAIQRTIDSTKHIPEELSERGKILLSRKEIRKKMGELFLKRSSINLHFDVLDTPEFFWEHGELEPIYSTVAQYAEITDRVTALNHRLNIVHELFEMLGSELNHQHSSKLEWTIIWLIVIEVVITFAEKLHLIQ